MIELPSRKDQDYVLSIIANWEESDVSPTLVLMIGDEDWSDRVPDGDVAQDGVALTVEATLAENLPLDLYGESITLDVSIGGVRVPMMRGAVSIPEDNDDRITTKLIAASAGSFTDEDFPLDERVEYSGVRPDYVARDAMRRLPYLPGSLSVETVDAPLLYFTRGHDEGPFEADQNVGDIYSKLEEKALYLFRDTAWGGCRAHVSAGLAQIPEIPDHLRYNSEDLLFWKSPALAFRRFAQIVVFKDNPDGSEAFKPARANVPLRGKDKPPPVGLKKRVPFTGMDAQEAQQLAYRIALQESRGAYKSEPILPFNPLLERTDVFSVTEVKKEPDRGFYEREWAHFTDAFEQPWSYDGGGEDGLETKPTCPTALLNEQLVKAPSLILGLISGGINLTPKPLYGPYGGDYFYFDEALSWVTGAGDYFTLDDAASGGIVTTTGDYFTVN